MLFLFLLLFEHLLDFPSFFELFVINGTDLLSFIAHDALLEVFFTRLHNPILPLALGLKLFLIFLKKLLLLFLILFTAFFFLFLSLFPKSADSFAAFRGPGQLRSLFILIDPFGNLSACAFVN